ncbi:ATP-binding protein [Pseudoalteromonas carrageenovora]|uniref:sensor histidine kinase n=1 Tax=Pseudoalteromonas TaxID=53246 RepID=UPI0026E17702|nr:ATP-binding protein [Pseudoalteromonas carrageenovora]MDO6637892.1 ATP-binding protein [Pseudoalteromonas carrageenovora]MDO6650207.1 ATP-binding protein [Pseudoalteromonas carrageenovora]
MKKFYISLLGSALLSIVVLGWLIDAFSQRAHTPQDEFSQQSRMITGFSKQLANIPTPERSSYVKQLAQEFDILIDYKPNESLALPPSLLLQMHTPDGLILEDQQGFYMLYSSEILNPFHLSMRLDKHSDGEQRNDIMLTLLFYAGLCVFMGFIIAPLAKRLTVLNEAAKKFASGNVQARIKVSHFTYIKDVELTFNRMASQIEKLVAENKLMASSLSHDIRTPIACLRFGLDAALDSHDEHKIKQYLARMENDLDHMESMLSSYLAFATLEQNANKLTYSSTNIKPYLEDILVQLAPKLESQMLSVQLNSSDDLISADLHWLARAITNLLTNACDFASQYIYLSAKLYEQQLIITVEDDGPGIARENFNNVFSPFFREEDHRNRADKSYGLGLAIVAKVADWHHGNVKVTKSNQLGGACFTLTIAQHYNP